MIFGTKKNTSKDSLDCPKRVAIIGAGAAGMSAAYAMSLCPEKFTVTVFERSANAGGMATSTRIDAEKYGAAYINDGVQGGSPVFNNTYALFETAGFTPTEVGFQISFGRDIGKDFWSNVFPSSLIDQHLSSIRRFKTVLRTSSALEPLFALLPIHVTLSLFCFPKDFGDALVFPLVALFMGTGNQTPYVSTAIVGRLFTDPSMRLFDYSEESFVQGIPEMRAFPCLSEVYKGLQTVIEARGNVQVRLNTEVTGVNRSFKYVDETGKREGVKLKYCGTTGTDLNQEVTEYVGEEATEVFDEIIIACDADAALKLLGSDAGWLEKRVLGNVKYLWDITVTHNDLAYLEKYYRTEFKEELASKKRLDEGDEETKQAVQFAKENFRPLYYVRSYPDDKKKIEMSFDLTNYQPQFKGESIFGPNSTGKSAAKQQNLSIEEDNAMASAREKRGLASGETPPLQEHVFQTIFLDKEGTSSMWTKDEIDKDKVILEKWWKQQSHRWQHYAGTVPWMMFLNGKRHTHFAGAWTILNMHEIAVCSGFAAAYRLGAPFPFAEKEGCGRLFKLTLGISHGARARPEDREGVLA